MDVTIRTMEAIDIAGAVALQRACFPPPFPEDLLWRSEHLQRHLEVFPDGQFVAVGGGNIVGSASTVIVAESTYRLHGSWEATVGGAFLEAHDPAGSTLYGVDISVHPDWRGLGIARRLYEKRFDLVRRMSLVRFATACRMPGLDHWLSMHPSESPSRYASFVETGALTDRTMTPLLRMGLSLVCVIQDYMEDSESRNFAALLEWKP